MSRGDMGGGSYDQRRSLAVATHVEAIQVLLGATVMCIIVMEDDGGVATVCPDNVKFQVLETLCHVDWAGEYMRLKSEQDAE